MIWTSWPRCDSRQRAVETASSEARAAIRGFWAKKRKKVVSHGSFTPFRCGSTVACGKCQLVSSRLSRKWIHLTVWLLHLSHTASLPAEQIKLQKDMRQSYHDHLPEASISFRNFLVRSRTSRSFDTALRPGYGVHGKIPAQVEIVS